MLAKIQKDAQSVYLHSLRSPERQKATAVQAWDEVILLFSTMTVVASCLR
jgi:hypothetical protein